MILNVQKKRFMRIFQPFFNHFSTILHQSNTNLRKSLTQVLHKSYANPTQVLRKAYAILHQSYTKPTQVLHKSSESLTPIQHQSYTRLTQGLHKSTKVLRKLLFTSLCHLFFELNEEFDQ